MLVTFGGVPATGVAVTGDDELFCLTPIHAKGAVDVVVQNLQSSPASVTTLPCPLAIAPGSTLQIDVGSGTQSLIFTPIDFANIAAVTAAELAAVLNRFVYSSAEKAGAAVTLRSDAVGASARLTIVGGTALAALGLSVGVSSGSVEPVPIEGEHFTLANAYTFALPNLTVMSHLAATVQTFIDQLQMQVLDPSESGGVTWAANTDYDAETNDLNVAYVGQLPAIVISGLDFLENRFRVQPERQEIDTPDGGYIAKDNPMTGDLQLVLLGIADDPITLLNLIAVLRRFFKKNGELTGIPLNPEIGAESETVDYEMSWSFTTNVTTSFQGGGSNVQSFVVTTWIREVQIWGMPGFAAIPGTKAGTGEDTVKKGWVAETLRLEMQSLRKPEPAPEPPADYSWATIEEGIDDQ